MGIGKIRDTGSVDPGRPIDEAPDTAPAQPEPQPSDAGVSRGAADLLSRLIGSLRSWSQLAGLFGGRKSAAQVPPVVDTAEAGRGAPTESVADSGVSLILPPPPKLKLNRPDVVAKLASGESLNGYNLEKLDLRTLDFSRVFGLRNSELEGAELDREGLAVLISNKARSSSFGYHLFGGVRFVRERLGGLVLDFCEFSGADFTGVDLRGTSVEGSIFSRAIFKWAKMDANVIQIIKEGRTRQGKDGLHDFIEIELSGENLEGADLSNLDLRGASFEKANLVGAKLFGSRIDYMGLWKIVEGGSRLGLDGKHDFCGVNFEGVSLSAFPGLEKLNLKDTNLRGVVLSKKGLEDIMAGGSRLKPGGIHDFQGVKLCSVDLRGLDLRLLDLKDAVLGGVLLGRRELEGLILSGTRKVESGLHDVRGMDLSGVDLTGLDLSSVNLGLARLDGVKMDRRNVINLVQNGSRMNHGGFHDFRGVNLAGVDLRGIDLSRVDFKDANLEGAQLERQQIVALILYRLHGSKNKPFQTAGSDQEIWEQIENLTPFLSPTDMFQVATLIPDVNINFRQLNQRLIEIAILVTRTMDRVEFGAFRKAIHNQPFNSHGSVIALYLSLAREGKIADGRPFKAGEQHEMIGLLEEAQGLDPQIHGAQEALRAEGHLGRELRTLGILYAGENDRLTLDHLVEFALQMREKIDTQTLSNLERIRIARVLRAVDSYAFGLCALDSHEVVGTAIQAKKMGTLILFLYGCGYGDKGWYETGARLLKLAKKWNEPWRTVEHNRDDLYRYGVLAYRFIEDVKDSYHDMFDPLLVRYKEPWRIDSSIVREFTRNIYRLGGMYPLGLHLAIMDVRPGGRNTVDRVLDILSRGRLDSDTPYQAYFFDEDGMEDVRILGGKGRGLKRLMKNRERGEYQAAAGFTLPPLLLRDKHLLPEHTQEIIRALGILERKTGRSFADGTLKVSVRSGACVSMPGMMSTELNVVSIPEVIDAAERVYQSWDSERAVSFRRFNGIPGRWGTSVHIVAMVNGEKDENSGAGVVTSFSPDGFERSMNYSYGKQVHGEELVSNRHSGTSPLPGGMKNRLKKVIKYWERKLKYPVELEFTVESGELYILQIRRARLEYEDEIRWVHSMVQDGRMTKQEGVDYLGGVRRLKRARKKVEIVVKEEIPILGGGKGTGNPLSARIVFDKEHTGAFQEAGAKFVYVTDNPDAGHSYEAVLMTGAAITAGGNPLSHLAVVAKEQRMSYMNNVPLKVDRKNRTVEINKTVLMEGDWVTMDPAKGRIFHGKLPIKEGPSDVVPLIERLLAEETTPPSPSGQGPASGGGGPMKPQGGGMRITPSNGMKPLLISEKGDETAVVTHGTGVQWREAHNLSHDRAVQAAPRTAIPVRARVLRAAFY